MPDDPYDDIIAAAAPPKPRKVIRGVEKLQGVQPDLVNHWNNLQTEFDKAGLSPAIKSGFRTAEQQNALHRRGYPTKGNDGFINISPHQEGRALDISFSGAQKPKGREIISAYAKQHGLHVPDDEPWHLALPKQQQGQSNDDYADVVKAATGQADDSYDDIISAAIPTKRQVVPRQGIGADVSVGGGLQRRGSKIQQDAARQQTQQALALPQRGAVPDVGGLVAEAARSPEAQRRGEIKQDVLAERERQRQSVSHQYGPSVGTPIGIHAVAKQAERVTHPIQTIHDLFTSEEDQIAAEVERRRSAEQRAVTPEMQAIRKEYGAMSTPARTVAQPLARAGAGILKTGGGIADLVSFTGLPTEKVRDWLNTRGNIVEEGASLAPLTATGAEVAKGIPEKVGQAITDLGLTVAQLMAMQKASGLSMSKLMGAEALLKTSDMPAAERAAHVTEATAMGKILEGHLSRSASAGLFGLPTGTQSATAVLEGKMSPEDALIQTGVAAGSGALLGGKKPETVPEHPSTMQAQLDARGFTLVPNGTPRPPMPRGTRTVTTTDGTVYYDPRRTDAATIRATPTADLLGHVEPKGPTTTEAVVARDADGKEVHASAVSPENVAAQAELTQRNFPDAKVETGGSDLADAVIAERVTPQRYQHLQFGEVEVVADQSGASTGRVKVAEVGDPTKIHYVKKADLQGRGNSRMIPVPAEAPASTPTVTPPTEGTAAAPVPSSPESTVPFADKMLPPEQRVELSPLEKELHDRLAKEFKGRRAAEREAEIDPLTRLGNRRAFDKAQETAPPDAFYIAVDGANLKAKNDAHGHPAGDEYIKNIANHLRETYGQAFRSGAKSDEFNAIDTVSKTPEEAQARFDKAVADFDAKYGEDVGGKRTGIDGGIGKTAAEADAAGTAAKALSKQKGGTPDASVTPTEAIEPTQVLSEGGGAGAAVSKPAYGSSNKFITAEKADAARARLKAKLDPSRLHDITDIVTALPDLVELGAYHVEAGSRQFAQWSKQFLNEFDDKDRKKIQPRLREIYEQSVAKATGPTSSIRNETTEQLRRTLDLSTVEPAERKSFQQSIDNALEKGLDKQAESIADDIISGKTESLSNEEAAGVLHRMRELENRYEELHAADKSDPELAKIEATLDRLTQATKQAGTATARDLNFRKATIDQDFKLISMIRQAKEAKGRDLTPEERTRYESIVKERDAAVKERDKAIEQLQSKRLQSQLDRDSRRRSRTETKAKLDEEAATIRSNIVAEFARLKGKFSTTQSMAGLGNLDPEGVITRNLLQYARNRAKATVGLKAEQLIDDAHELVKDFGVTRRQVAEALSGFGKVAVDRRSEAAKQLADIRSEITRLLKEEDIAAGRISGKQEGPKRDFARNENRLKVLRKAEAEWERKFNERDFDPKPKHPYPYNSDVRRAEDRVKIAEAKFRREMERARPGHQFRNLSGIWKAWLLSGPPTQAMNIIGTGTYQAFREVARLPAAIADGLASTVTGRRSMQGPSPVAMIESVVEGMGKRGMRDFFETMRHGATAEQMKRHQFEEIDFGTNSRAVRLIEQAHNAIFRFMSASDRVFYQGALRRNLLDRATMQAKNEGVSDVKGRVRDLMNDPEIKASAEHDAFVSTFNNDNVLSDKIKRARSAVINKRSLMSKKNAMRLNAAENFALDLILPFDRTPTNVIARILEASPLGYGKNATQLIAAAMRKSMPVEHQRQFAQTFGNATAGTAIMALGWYLASPDKKVITVDDQDVNLNIGGKKVNLRTASPLGNILAAGARMRTIHDDPKSSKGDYAKTALREPANQPVLRATTGLSELMTDPDRSAGKFFGRLASSAIPFSGAARFAGQQMDPANKRYADPSFAEQFKKNIPVSRETLPASRVRLLGSNVTKATKEAERLKLTIKGATRQPDESEDDFAKRRAVQDPAIRTQIENVVALPEYDAASDADKTKWLKQAAQFASKRTMESLPEKPEPPEQRQFPMPQSGTGFDAAFPADALSKYERMNPTQRTAVRGSMQQKARVLLSDPRLSDEQKAEYKQRLDALGITTKPRRTMRELTIGGAP